VILGSSDATMWLLGRGTAGHLMSLLLLLQRHPFLQESDKHFTTIQYAKEAMIQTR